MIIAGVYADTAYVVALTGFAGIVLLGIQVARRTLGVVSRRSQLEEVKLDVEIDRIKHVRNISQVSQQREMLQLTAGSEGDQKEVKEAADAARREAESQPEVVAVGLKDYKEPPHVHKPTEQWREEREALDGDFSPI